MNFLDSCLRRNDGRGLDQRLLSAGLAPGARRARGLTLIELMVVVAVIAILATIVYPAYERMIRSVRRADGRTLAHAVALAEERFFTVNGRYSVSPASIFPVAGTLDCSGTNWKNNPYPCGRSEKGYYELDHSGARTVAPGATGIIASSFIVKVDAIPNTSQDVADEKAVCDELTLNSAGVEGGTPNSDNGGKCWPKEY